MKPIFALPLAAIVAIACALPWAASNGMAGVDQSAAVPQQVVPLPGGLNDVPVLNSNSPEVVEQAGILVSTLPKQGKLHPEAHLDYAFNGRFDIFVHHIARADWQDAPTLYIGIALYNAGDQPRVVEILQAGSYLSQPDAPFKDLPPLLDNDLGTVYSGPGDRLMDDFLHGCSQAGWPSRVTVPAGKTVMIGSLPIPVRGLTPPLNGRSTLIKLRSDGPVYAATLAVFARRTGIVPNDDEWFSLLEQGGLAGPREQAPSPPGASGPVAYGRVAGVSIGDQWQACVEDMEHALARCCRPPAMVSFPLSTVAGATLGTGQVQSAPLAVREPGTAYAAHGNYAVLYQVSVPLVNQFATDMKFALSLQTPLKSESPGAALKFSDRPAQKIFFRGSLKVDFVDNNGQHHEQYVHLVQHAGDQSQPFWSIILPPHAEQTVQVSWYYPPDATPPQALTVAVSACR